MSMQPEATPPLNPDVSAHVVERALEQLEPLRVAVVGETIIDEYAYCDAIGKSGKEPMLVGSFLRCEAQAGGALAIANHLADFCQNVEVVSALGSFDRREEFVRDALRDNVRATLVTKPDSPTIVKRRYIDALSKSKLLGVYHMNGSPLTDVAPLEAAIRTAMARADLVIVADYGHGLLTESPVRLLTAHAKFLAVNTQINAANVGYNVLSKYPRFDFACVHEGELRLDAREADGPLEPLLARAKTRAQARALMVTRGFRGTVLITADDTIESCPALAERVVERVGAGDAVLALASVSLAAGLDPAVASVLANLGGAQAVTTVGNGASIRRTDIIAAARRRLPETCRPRLCVGDPR
ncbi:MAG: hypothetical protein B7733_02730 [Myxococcales bacterium FL481]|nr:MAG: hypothetical protein B7733_02730 [Myxococcales bacterium FL481]